MNANETLQLRVRELQPADFISLSSANGHGMEGSLSATTDHGQFELQALLTADFPDAADDDERSSYTLSLMLNDAEGRELIRVDDLPYSYAGDAPGSYLRMLLREGDLLPLLFNARTQ